MLRLLALLLVLVAAVCAAPAAAQEVVVPPPPPAPPSPPAEVVDDGYEDPWQEPEIPLVTTPTVAGSVAMLRTNGKAAIPRGAPKRVRAILAAGNRIVGKPYKWGGGHARLIDRGYDCSGTVSYALIVSRTNLLSVPMVSGSFARWGAAGKGRWVTVYANRGHVYMEVAGLRLDTSAVNDPRGGNGPRWRPVIGQRRGFTKRHPLGL
ncbi:MAG TPA: hypothetical protein VF587_09275 [Solirubrobacteraceae bacterium]